MTNKKVFECSRNCKNCTYENKQCGGYDEFSECISDKCPSNNYSIGNIDSVGGKHTNEGHWNPIGERCSLCAPKDCTNCDKWKRRQAENKTQQKAEAPKKPSSNAAMWGAIFDDVYDMNDSVTTKTIVKEEKSEIIAEQPIEDKVEEVIAEIENETTIIEEIVENTNVEEEMVTPSFVEIEEPDIPEEPEIPEEIDIPDDIDDIKDIEIPKEENISENEDIIKTQETIEEKQEPVEEIVDTKLEEPKVEEKVEETKSETKQPSKFSIFDDDDDFDYSSFKNVTVQKWPNKPTIVVEESKQTVTKEVEEEIENIEEEPIVSEPTVETDTVTKELTEDVTAETITEAEADDVVEEVKEETSENHNPVQIETPLEIKLDPEEEEEEEEEKPSTTQRKFFDTSLFSKWFKRGKPQPSTKEEQPKEETMNSTKETSEKPLENSEKCDIIKEEPVTEIKTEKIIKSKKEIVFEEESEDDTESVAVESFGNDYIKASWLDGDDTQDYDEDGNLVQGIYRIDPSGKKTIVTVFDDDTNVKYIKTSRPQMSSTFRNSTDDNRVVEMQTDAWRVSDAIELPDEEEPSSGIVGYTNQFPTSEVVEVEKPDVNPILDEKTEKVETSSDNDDVEETTSEAFEDEGEDIDFGEDLTSIEDGMEFDDGYNDAMFEQDEIPEPEEYRMEREEYEEAGIEESDAEEVDEEYEDADFDMTDSAKFKASLLTPIGEEIAKLQINNNGVYLSVLGDCKITIKGRNDSDGFSYRDARRFPKYIIDKVLNKSIYRDPNMEVIDNTYFNLTYYEIKNGEIIPIDDVRLDVVFENPTPDSVKEVLYNEYKKFLNK